MTNAERIAYWRAKPEGSPTPAAVARLEWLLECLATAPVKDWTAEYVGGDEIGVRNDRVTNCWYTIDASGRARIWRKTITSWEVSPECGMVVCGPE